MPDANAAGNGTGGVNHQRAGETPGAVPSIGPVPSGSGDAGSSGPTRLHSSKSRYLAYLARRRDDAKARGAAKPSAPGPVGPRTLGDEDPNSPRRVRRSRSFWTLLREFWSMIRGHRPTVLLCIGT